MKDRPRTEYVAALLPQLVFITGWIRGKVSRTKPHPTKAHMAGILSFILLLPGCKSRRAATVRVDVISPKLIAFLENAGLRDDMMVTVQGTLQNRLRPGRKDYDVFVDARLVFIHNTPMNPAPEPGVYESLLPKQLAETATALLEDGATIEDMRSFLEMDILPRLNGAASEDRPSEVG